MTRSYGIPTNLYTVAVSKVEGATPKITYDKYDISLLYVLGDTFHHDMTF